MAAEAHDPQDPGGTLERGGSPGCCARREQDIWVLGVYYPDLKNRVAAAGKSSRERSTPPAFVELLSSPVMSPAEHVVELEHACGAKMRIQMRGGSPPDLVALSRLFLEQAP